MTATARHESETPSTGARGTATGVRVRIPVRIDFAGGWSDVHHFSGREGGAVVNATIDHYVEGSAGWATDMRVDYGTALPRGSGLGSSGALDVAFLALTNGLMHRAVTATQLAEDAYRLEKLLGVEGGKQDQYAAALGGFNYLTFGAEGEPARVEQLTVSDEVAVALEERIVLCYTGAGHHSGSLHEQVWAPYLRGDDRITGALREIRDSVRPARDALVRGDPEAVAELMTLNREAARRLVPNVVTPEMDRLIGAAERAGSIGSKPCGAGGGGCLLFVVAHGKRESVEAALKRTGAKIMPFRFERYSYWGERALEAHE